MNIEILNKIPNAEEYNFLRKSVGWGTYERQLIDKALQNSLFSICALADNNLIGMARIIGDGGLVYYIQDLIVLPQYQNKGIGRMLMDKIMEYFQAHASHRSIIGLMSAKGKEKFYENYGFINRPTENFGSGMTMFWISGKTDV
jgi:ribosomal protein S18 acetylase RimI-like enzyme